ncbi:hypothetical protein SBOR_4306 [Sclerotinia borealis F-4128]|uniref:Uncharacterized protein n=1 Tax=Sclerotinia borealis (strain F-4128) TaxID=1432307 RepID=W9CL10_SCLBF|nr:hypothetical protein SBOR_4306 [Sclerotinia borealis F-4128]
MASQVKFLIALCVLLLNALVTATNYDLFFQAGADIAMTKFEGTVTVPAFAKTGAHFFSAGLKNQDHSYGYENVLNDHNAGEYEVDIQYIKAGLGERTTYSEQNFQQIAPNAGKLNVASIHVGLQSGAAWDFGTVRWENVVFTAQTTDNKWCIDGWKNSVELQGNTPGLLLWGQGDLLFCKFEYINIPPRD